MRLALCTGAAASSLLSGCATMPRESIDHVSLFAVEERVKCEIGSAYRTLSETRRYPDLDLWAAGLTMTLSVDSTGGVAPSSSLTGPFGSVGPIEVSLGASLNTKRTALMNVYVAFVEAADLERHPCPPVNSLLEGHIGLSDWIVRTFEAYHATDRNSGLHSDFNSEKSVGYTIEFLITTSLGVTPNFIIAKHDGYKSGLYARSESDSFC